MTRRRLLIVEYLYAGFVGMRDVSASMLREGRAMLLALLEDASRMEDVQVTTIRHVQTAAPPVGAVRVLETTSPANAVRAWRSALKEVELVYIIAPETDDVLRSLCEEAIASGARVLNCLPDTIDAAGDKWETCHRLASAGIPTIHTLPLSDFRPDVEEASPLGWVVKPRHGCGSEGIRLITDVRDLISIAVTPEMIIQPFTPGQPASVAALFDNDGRPSDIFPLAFQRLSSDLRYLGGCVPVMTHQIGVAPEVEEISTMLDRIGSVFPGLRGYVGIDLLIQPNGHCVVVEINPRLTTSYIGYRRLTKMNLAERWLSFSPVSFRPIAWQERLVSFSPDGTSGFAELC